MLRVAQDQKEGKLCKLIFWAQVGLYGIDVNDKTRLKSGLIVKLKISSSIWA